MFEIKNWMHIVFSKFQQKPFISLIIITRVFFFLEINAFSDLY